MLRILATGLIALLFCSQPLQAKITLVKGSYINRSVIDTGMRQANLNFEYEGCDPQPSIGKLKINTDGMCKNVEAFNLAVSQDKTITSGLVGDVFVEYDEPTQKCEKTYKKVLTKNFSLVDVYKKFAQQNCRPTHIVIRDNRSEETHRRIWKAQRNKSLCRLQMAQVSKKGFPTESDPLLNMTANDEGFKIGDHTLYRFDHDNKVWCVKYKSNADKCGYWPTPLPLAYKSSDTNQFHLKGTVTLRPDGTASLRAIDKSYPDLKAMANDQKKGEFQKTQSDKGRIDYKTWRKPNGLVRSIVKSYDKDTPNANHERSLNFFARNVFGIGITNAWCKDEHCFLRVKTERMSPHACSDKPKIEMSNGASGNTCHSCVGIMPGHCAIEPQEVAVVRSNLKQDKSFTVLHTGEYKMGQNIEAGLINNFQNIIASPKNPGCHTGYAPAFDDIFDRVEESSPSRSVNSQSKSL